MNDFHSHIVSGVDDGAKDETMTMAMIKMAAASGTEKIVATPHYRRGIFQVPRKDIKEKINELRNEVKVSEIPIEIYEGQEVYYSENILEDYLQGEIGPIEDTRYMLVELPIKAFNSDKVIDTLYELQLKGLVIILAHPERYMEFIRKPSLINKFLQEGFLFQLNTGSIAGNFGREVKKTAEVFLKHRIYTVLGSDGHKIRTRNTDMREGLEELERIQPGSSELLSENIEKILRNEEIRSLGKKVEEVKGIKGLIKRIFN